MTLCPSCGAGDHDPVYHSPAFSWLRCRACGKMLCTRAQQNRGKLVRAGGVWMVCYEIAGEMEWR